MPFLCPASFALQKKFGHSKDASFVFYRDARQVGNQVENMLANRQYKDIEEIADKIKDPNSTGQNKSVDSLSPEFGNRVKAFLASPEARAKGVTIREARRSPLTQLAYFSRGRAPDEDFVHRMYKKAGFPGGAWSPRTQNTQTLGSEHFFGNAVDLEDRGKGESFYKEIAPVAKKYGLEWGGDWPGWNDYPHFQLPKNDSDIGYKGPPSKEDTPLSKDEMQRADGEGFRYYNKATLTPMTRTATTQAPQRALIIWGLPLLPLYTLKKALS
jgi:peptidoglycan L-alanyl-D-glutamate endopeptidase CwlK